MARDLAAGGFRDTTRVASGDPAMMLDICDANTAALLTSLDAYIETLRSLRARIATGDVTLEDTLASAKHTRDSWLRAREHPSHSEPDA
jgi:prephenate dehydrogenase